MGFTSIYMNKVERLKSILNDHRRHLENDIEQDIDLVDFMEESLDSIGKTNRSLNFLRRNMSPSPVDRSLNMMKHKRVESRSNDRVEEVSAYLDYGVSSRNLETYSKLGSEVQPTNSARSDIYRTGNKNEKDSSLKSKESKGSYFSSVIVPDSKFRKLKNDPKSNSFILGEVSSSFLPNRLSQRRGEEGKDSRQSVNTSKLKVPPLLTSRLNKKPTESKIHNIKSTEKYQGERSSIVITL